MLGDLNYRVSLPEATTRFLVEIKDWDTLLQNDQVINYNYVDKLTKNIYRTHFLKQSKYYHPKLDSQTFSKITYLKHYGLYSLIRIGKPNLCYSI